MSAPRPLGLDSLAKTQKRIVKAAVAVYLLALTASAAIVALLIWLLVVLIQHLSR